MGGPVPPCKGHHLPSHAPTCARWACSPKRGVFLLSCQILRPTWDVATTLPNHVMRSCLRATGVLVILAWTLGAALSHARAQAFAATKAPRDGTCQFSAGLSVPDR